MVGAAKENDLFVFFFIKKIFLKFNKNSIVCSICLPNRHSLQTREHSKPYSYTSIHKLHEYMQ